LKINFYTYICVFVYVKEYNIEYFGVKIARRAFSFAEKLILSIP